MHYKWQVLVMALDAQQAEEKTKDVMNNIGGNGHVWDWYAIGGRWREKKNAVPATTKAFWDRLAEAEKSYADNLQQCRDRLLEELAKKEMSVEAFVLSGTDTMGDMATFYLKKVAAFMYHEYQSDSHIATSGEVWGSPEVPDKTKKAIKQSPKEHWLVTVDVHN